MKPTEIKIIDFGSACMEVKTIYSYIQVLLVSYLSFYSILSNQAIELSCLIHFSTESLLQIAGSFTWVPVSFLV